MNFLKSFSFGLWAIFCLSFSGLALAQDTSSMEVVDNPGQVIVGTVGITDAKMIAKEGSSFEVSFSLSNKEILQSGVKYGVQLFKDSKHLIDEKAYEESMTLYENSVTRKQFVYTPPNNLSGEYQLVLIIMNENFFPFGTHFLGKVNLSSSVKGIRILNETCYLTVEGGASNTKYGLLQNVDINTQESLRLTCVAINDTNKTQIVTPVFETRKYSSFGSVTPHQGGDGKTILFAANERKNISLILPKGATPNFYSLKARLVNDQVLSNDIIVRYVVSGFNAIIQKISLDKDYYLRGEKGEIALLWSVSVGEFSRSVSTASKIIPKTFFDARLVDKDGKACSGPIKKELVQDSNNPQTKIPFRATRDCVNPTVEAKITDISGNVFDGGSFSFKTDITKETRSGKFLSWPVIVVVLLLILVLGFYFWKKKRNPEAQESTNII